MGSCAAGVECSFKVFAVSFAYVSAILKRLKIFANVPWSPTFETIAISIAVRAPIMARRRISVCELITTRPASLYFAAQLFTYGKGRSELIHV
jgi:hypothetical protein